VSCVPRCVGGDRQEICGDCQAFWLVVEDDMLRKSSEDICGRHQKEGEKGVRAVLP
jgi:hypothetical protein